MRQVAFLFAWMVGLGLPVGAQIGVMELLPEWGQAGWSNPALIHPSGGFIGLGPLAGTQFQVVHSGPAFMDFATAEGVVNPEDLLANMDPVESLGFRSEVPLLSIGFRDKKKFEFRYRSRLVAEQQFSYDRDLFELAWKGNGHPDLLGRPVSLSGMGLNAQAYLDHGLSVGAMAKEDKLWLGWGIHILNGIGGVETSDFEAAWTTDATDYSWTLEGGVGVNASGVNVDSLLEGGEAIAPFSGLPPTVGAGVAFDFGFLWKVTEQFDLEGSMEGRGSIRWLESVSRYEVEPDVFVLQGLDLVDLWSSGEVDSGLDSAGSWLDEWSENMLDSLAETFSGSTLSGPPAVFDSRTRETWRLGIRFRPVETVEIHALGYRQFQFGDSRQGFLFGVTHRFRNNIASHVQAQRFDDRWSFGAGVSLRGGPVRLSLSTQNGYGILAPLESGHWHGQFGLSFELGTAQEETKRRKQGDLGTGRGMWH